MGGHDYSGGQAVNSWDWQPGSASGGREGDGGPVSTWPLLRGREFDCAGRLCCVLEPV